MLDKKPTRYLEQQVSAPPLDLKTDLYGMEYQTIVYGSESNSHYVDVISVGEIGGVEQIYLDETPSDSGEYPKSTFYVHTGAGATTPWAGDFPYVERTVSLSKNADIKEVGAGNYSETTFTRKVSSLGVVGLRINFTTAGFTHKDNKNREKTARAQFTIEVLDTNGFVVATKTSEYKDFSAKNPTALQVYIAPPEGYESTHWEYRVTMSVRGFYYRTNVSGNWTAATATEIYKDTQKYDKIAFSSGTIVASDTSGKLPKRQYLANGYKVLVPTYQEIGGNQVLTGEFTRETSDSHAWNAVAVITDELWGAGLPLDKVDLVSFLKLEENCARIVDGERNFSYSQYLIQSDDYYKLASEIVGAADGRLYEDTTGRIGVMLDTQVDARRVITSYDVVDEAVKRTTVSENKKINYVEAEFEDESNLYKKTIIFTEDSSAINNYGVISKKLKLDTCTRLKEAQRTIKKVLATSQVTTSSYVFKVGHTHEDIQIGEVVELYDRKYANINYCGKVAAGSTLSVIQVDPRTPINLTGLKSPVFTIDNNRGIPTKVAVASWTSHSITLVSNLPTIPADFTSFGVDDADDTGVKPTLIRVLGVDDVKGVLSIEGVEYNDSLQSYVENGTQLVVHKYRYTPEQQNVDITGLSLVQTLTGLSASWDVLVGGYEYGYVWKVIPVGQTTPITVSSGVTANNYITTPNPLMEGLYQVQVFPVLSGEQVGDFKVATLSVVTSIGSSLPKPTNLVVVQEDGTLSDKYLSDSFTLQWDQVEESGGVTVSHFKLRLAQNALTKEVIVDGADRSYYFSASDLTEYFGNYTRQFNVEIVTVDSELHTTSATQLVINNIEPPLPTVVIEDIGSIFLSYSPEIPTDIIGAKVYLWESNNIGESIPTDAKVIISSTPSLVSIPEGYVKTDGTPYVFDVRWIDGFGDSSLSTRTIFAFNPDEQIPEPPELTTVTPIDSQTVLVNFTHDGTYLKKMKISYNRVGTDTWIELAEIFNIPPTGSNNDYDAVEGTGFIKVAGLVRNFEYEFKAVAANTSSSYSDESNIITGSPYLDVTTGEDLEDITDLVNLVGNDLNLKLTTETINRKETDKALFDTAASAVQLRKDLDNGMAGFTDAIFEVDPETGQIRNRAFAYTDESFSQANLLIDGVSAEVVIQAERITETEGRLTDAEATISVQAGQIELKASYTEVNEIVAGAIDAILPVYSFGFFNSAEGWSAVNGTLTPATNKVSLTFGDIENQSLSYIADDNPFISISIERLAGTGWKGDLIVSYDSAPDQTYLGVISQVDAGGVIVRNLNLSGEPTYTGTVTGIRLVFGTSVADTFEVSSITIGKPSAAQESLEGLTAQVNQLGIDIDAVEGSLVNYVTTAFYTANSVTFNNLDVTLDGADAIISLKATQQELDENDVVTKANSAAIWIDASESNITQVVTAYNAQPDGIDDQIQDLNDQYNLVQSEIDASLGLIRDQSVSINRLGNKDKDVEKNAFYAATQLLKQRDGILEVGEAVATADRQLQALTDDVSALSQEVVELTASFGSELGQINASFTSVNQAIATETQARVISDNTLTASVAENSAEIENTNLALVTETNARVEAIDSLTATVQDNTASIVSVNQAVVDETNARVAAIDQLTAQVADDIALVDTSAKAAIGYCMIGGNPSSHETKALCESAGGTWVNSTLATATRTVQVSSGGNTSTVGDFYESYIDLEGNVSGKAVIGVDVNGTWTGMSVVGGNNYSKITFKGNAVEFQTAAGTPALYWNSVDNVWVFNGRLVVGGYQVDGESDIRALDGDTIYEKYQYSINGSTSWHDTYVTGDLFRRTATVTNGVIGTWSAAARITGIDGASGTNGLNNATVFLYKRSTTTPTLPSTTTTYTFATKLLTGANNGWTQAIPVGTDPIYVTAATASSSGTTDTIASNEWSGATVLAQNGADGQDGATGLNSATIFLYRRSTITPTLPSVTSTYTFSSGVLIGANNSWTQAIPTGTEPLYVTTATAVASTATDTILASEWAAAKVLAKNGEDATTIVAEVDYQFTSSTDGWIASQSTLVPNSTYVTYTTTAADPNLIRTGVNVVGSDNYVITFRVRCTSGNVTGNRIDIFYATSSHGFAGEYLYRVDNVSFVQNEWRTFAFDMRELTEGGNDWIENVITNLRIDLTNYVGVTFDIDYISIGKYGAAVDGAVGAAGAGFYGSTYTTIDWTTATANSRFNTLVGRQPIALDIFTQTRIDGADSQARQYNGSSWVAVALQVNGSIVAKNTVAGDRLVAGTSITAPVIKGGVLQLVGTTHMKYSASVPFGANSLIDWYGAKVNGVNWNTTTLEPIPSGMLKSNAITYLDSNGNAYFGGSILAGTLRNAAQSTQKAQNVTIDTGTYSSQGGIITIKSSLSVSVNIIGSGSCPTIANPIATLRLYSVSALNVETLVATQVVNGQYNCTVEGSENYQTYTIGGSGGSFTYTDTAQSTADRRYRLKVEHNAPIASGEPTSSQSLSIISEE